jgi:tripartite-type tricarboxylate transporter receptor subunit TctC
MRISDKRGWLGALVGTMGLVLLLGGASAQTQFPDKGLTLIVAYGAGGGTDVTARLLAKDLEKTIGQSVTVRNITGGGGWNGWSAIASANPDGYTIGYINIPNMYAGYLDRKVGRKESLESFTPLMNHVTDYCIWAVRPDSPYKSVGDVVAAAKKNPGSISVTAHGFGNDDHLAILAMQNTAGVEFKVVHNKSTATSKSQVLGGHVDILGGNLSEVAAEAKAGELRVLGVMAKSKSKFLPNVRTFKEQGYDQVWSVSRGISGPADLPDHLKAQLIGFLEKTISSQEHRQQAEKLSLEPEIVKGDEYRQFLKTTEQEIKKLMKW